MKGGKGDDSISGNNGPDFVLGGAGKDGIRGGGGEDSLKGQDAKDNIRGSGGGDNIYGGRARTSASAAAGTTSSRCEKPKDKPGNGPNGPGLHQRSEPRGNGAPLEFREAKGTGPLGGRFLCVRSL